MHYLDSTYDKSFVIDSVSYLSFFSINFSLLLSIVIAICATFFIFMSARKMHGGLFGATLNLLGFGMFNITLATISIAIASLLGEWFELVNMTFFVAGFVCVVLGAQKLIKGISL